MEGQGVIETDNQGNYQFTPAEGYTGDVQVGFIATDGENRIESFFNVDIQGEGETTISEGYALADDGSLTLTEAQLIDELGISLLQKCWMSPMQTMLVSLRNQVMKSGHTGRTMTSMAIWLWMFRSTTTVKYRLRI